MDVVVKACYDVRESSAFWQKLALRSQLSEESDSDDAPQWLSTHPDHESRAKKLDGMIPAVSFVNVLLGLPMMLLVGWPAKIPKISPVVTVWGPSLPGITVEENLA